MNNKNSPDFATGSTVFLLCIIALFLINHCWKRRRIYYYGSKIPGISGLPFLGSIELFIHGRKAHIYKMLEFAQKFKPIGKFWIGSDMVVMVMQPDYIELLTRKCLAKGKFYELLKLGFGEGLLTAPLEKWKKHRPIINRTFKHKILCSYMPIFAKHTDKMLEQFKKLQNTKFDIFEEYSKCTFSIINESCMGVDWSEKQEQSDYLAATNRGGQITSERMFSPWYQIDLIFKMSALYKEIPILEEKVWGHTRRVIKFKKAEFLNNEDDVLTQPCFLNDLLKITYVDGAWTDAELTDETQTMIAAGSDTSAVTLSFLAVLLALHPEIQEKVYQELCSIFQDGHVDITLDDLNKMDYLDRAIKETMRLFPVAPIIMRQVDEDIQVGKYLVPKGTTLFIPIIFLHRDATLWPDPLKFDPDRHLPEEIQKRPRHAYMPFSLGPRNCVGLKFSEMSLKVTMAKVLTHFKITSTEYKSVDDIKVQFEIVIAPQRGFNLILVPRNT